MKRTRSEDCVSDFAMDQLLASELSKDREREVRKHLFSCLECTARMEKLRQGRDAFLAEGGPVLTLVRPDVSGPAPARRRWLPFAGGFAAAAAAAVLFLALPGPVDSTRTKGSAKLGFYVKHDAEVRRGSSAEVVAPGDSLRFTYSLEQPKHLAIISVDAAKKASVYFPSGQVTSEMPVGRDVPLPSAALLDETLGEEVIYGLFCRDSLPVESVRAAFEQGDISAPEGCELEKMTISKK